MSVVGQRARTGRLTIPIGVFATASVALLGWTWWMGRGFGFFSDEWNVAILANQHKLLEPFNGHLTLVPQLVYLGLSRTVGLAHYGPYRFVALACYVVLAGLVALHAARRATPLVGALAGAAVLWCSAARLTLLFPLLINFTVPAGCCIAIWLLLDRDRPHDVMGAVLLGVALASSAVGVVAAIAVVVELAARRIGLRRAMPYAVPVLLWVVWWIAFHTTTAQPGGAGELASFAGREVLGSFAALCAGWTPGGWVLLAAFVLLFVVSLTRWRTFDARGASCLAGYGAFVVLTAIGRQGIGSNGLPLPKIEPTTDRYLFVNVVFLLCAAATMAGPRIHERALPAAARTERPRRGHVFAAAGSAVAVGLIVVNGLHLAVDVRTYRHDQLAYQASVRTFTLGARLAGPAVDRRRVLPINYIAVTAGVYLDLLHKTPTTPLPHDTSRLGTAYDRRQADGWLARDLHLELTTVQSRCAVHRSPSSPVGSVTAKPGDTVAIEAPPTTAVEVTVRRLARRAGPTPIGTVRPGQGAALVLPRDPGSDLPWVVSTTSGPDAGVSACH